MIVLKQRYEKEWTVTICICFLLISKLCHGVYAQNMPSLPGDWYDSSTNYKTDFCDHHSVYKNEGGLEWPTVLQDRNISLMAVPSQYFRLDEKTGGLDPTYPGLIPEVLDELARRGRFHWRQTFGVLEKPDDIKFQHLLDWTVNAYDIGVNDWILSVPRLKSGFSFAELFDASPILITIKPEYKPIVNLWNWHLPFDAPVWLCIIGTILVSALVYLFLCAMNDGQYYATQPKHKLVSDNLYLSSLMFTQNMNYEPRSNAMKIFVASFSLWSLFVTSAYTANLASFLVIRNTPDIEIESIDDAIRHNVPICVWNTTIIDDYVTVNYPDAKLLKKPHKNDLYQGLRNGECALAVISKHYWQFDEVNKETNGDCKLYWVGRALTQMSAGFVTKTDYGQLCTTLLSDVFDMHIEDIKKTGIIERLTKKALRYSKDSTCIRESVIERETKEKKVALDLHSMAGTFALHAIFSLVAIVVSFIAPKVKNAADKASIGLTRTEKRQSDSNTIDEECPPIPTQNQHQYDMKNDKTKKLYDIRFHVIRSDLKNFASNNEKMGKLMMKNHAKQDKQIAELRSQVAKMYHVLKGTQSDKSKRKKKKKRKDSER